MEIKQDYDFWDLLDNCWGRALDTLNLIKDNDKEYDAVDVIESYFDDVPTLTEVNDLLAFSDDTVLKDLGIDRYAEDDEEDDEESESEEEIEEIEE